jgi:hypothetical protein
MISNSEIIGNQVLSFRRLMQRPKVLVKLFLKVRKSFVYYWKYQCRLNYETIKLPMNDILNRMFLEQYVCTGGPRHMCSFYPRFCVYAIQKWPFSGTYPLINSHPWSFYMWICYIRVYFWSPYLSHITRSTCSPFFSSI